MQPACCMPDVDHTIPVHLYHSRAPVLYNIYIYYIMNTYMQSYHIRLFGGHIRSAHFECAVHI